MTQDNKKYYLHYDQVGSLRTVTDTSHNIIKEVSYDTFGTLLTDSNPSFNIPFGFAGGLYDTDTKLTRFGYRDYDAYVGKWTAKDPIDFAGGDSNLYGYVLGDPVGFVDPMGLWIWGEDEFDFKKEVCRKIGDGAPDFANRATKQCLLRVHNVHKATICAAVFNDAYEYYQTNTIKIPICNEDKEKNKVCELNE